MKVTVILCTYNRCRSLVRALESLVASQLPPAAEWEVLVVDNNSTDQTREVVADFALRFAGRVRYVLEPRQGLSYARNAGIQEAGGDVLAFVDDDVTVEPEWLARLTSIFQEGSWAGAGGPILPESGFKLPPWISPSALHLSAPFAHFNPCSDPGELAEPPWGANMAFRKAMFQKYGGFRTDLGLRPGSRITNEDIEFGRRLLAAGERLFYVPTAVVYHPVPEERLREQYHLAWWFGHGRANVREFGVPSGTRLSGVPLHLFGRAMILALRWILALGPSRRFAFKRSLWSALGAIKECFDESRNPNTSHKANLCI
jgi:glycosyltransferase involved in cell wall biosynthesis